MATGVLMPKAGITVEECMITHWDKKVGDLVKVGDILFSYETDKAAFECESTAEGEILEIFFDDGAEVPVLVNVCVIGKAGEDVSALRPDGAKKADEVSSVSAPQHEIVKEDVTVAAPIAVQPENSELKISPRARNLAEKTGADPGMATPTGPYGRIIEQDIRTLSENGGGTGIGGKIRVEDLSAVAKPDDEGKAIPSPDVNEYTDIKFSKIRSAIAQAMSTSLSTSAQLTHHHSFDATNILALRKGLKENAERLRLPNITLNDFILYAVSRTLLNHPDLNAHIVDGNILRRFKDVHLGVAIDTPRGLMVPVIFFANRKSLSEIAIEAKELAKQAQAGTINPDLLQGGTFTISNLGA